MLVEVTFVRDARSITQLAPETEIEADNVVAGAFIRNLRAAFSEGIVTGHAGATAFIQLTDVPSSYSGAAGKLAAVKGDESGLEFIPVPSGVTDFLALTDAPDSYSGEAGKLTAVKGDESGLEFIPVPSGAPVNAHYLTTQSEGGLGNEFNLGGLSSGILKQAVTTGVSTPAIAVSGTDYVDPSDSRLSNDRTANALRTLTAKAIDNAADPTNGQVLAYDSASGKWKPLTPAAITIVSNFTFGLKKSSGVPVGKLPGYWTCPFSGVISAWNITVDTGTITLKIWKIATGTAHPTNANSINTSGIALATGTAIRSTTLTDFTTLAVSAGDIFAVEVTAVSGVTDFGGAVEITRS